MRKGPPATSGHHRYIPAGLFLLGLLVFWRALSGDFIALDDDFYVTNNTHVRDGLTWSGIQWALGSVTYIYYQPVTWISHMIDCEIFGLKPAGHHLTSLLLHATNSALLFLVLRKMTGAIWRSAFAAALFAIHPLRVESVAWIAERKDVLSGFFYMLTLWAYPNKLWTAACMFTLALLSKPTAVTLPFVLLLLDYWPLRRLPPWGQRVRETIPFFVLAAVISVLTYIGQKETGATVDLGESPFILRVENAVVSYARYLTNTLFPTSLAAVYPFPLEIPIWQTLGASILLAGLTYLIWKNRRTRPYLLVGWLWFLGVLVPMIGIIRAGSQAMADRFTYLPSIGLAIMIAWGAAEFAYRWKLRTRVLAAAVPLIILAVLTIHQTGFWLNSQTLFEHSLSIEPNSAIIHLNLGHVLLTQRHVPEAAAHFAEASRIEPANQLAHLNLGAARYKLGDMAGAAVSYAETARLAPGSAEARFWLAMTLRNLGRKQEALLHFQEALQGSLSTEEAANAHSNVGALLLEQGSYPAAEKSLKTALELQPALVAAHRNLAIMLIRQKRLPEAIAQLNAALRITGDREIQAMLDQLGSR
ncbi:MAG TPA: tetratricopeptide repeat protein [Bryobacteraceae bacterium]|nr:tetratricopeptide repeat protein [Bryobacteraceae bacterium]